MKGRIKGDRNPSPIFLEIKQKITRNIPIVEGGTTWCQHEALAPYSQAKFCIHCDWFSKFWLLNSILTGCSNTMLFLIITLCNSFPDPEHKNYHFFIVTVIVTVYVSNSNCEQLGEYTKRKLPKELEFPSFFFCYLLHLKYIAWWCKGHVRGNGLDVQLRLRLWPLIDHPRWCLYLYCSHNSTDLQCLFPAKPDWDSSERFKESSCEIREWKRNSGMFDGGPGYGVRLLSSED